MLWVMRGLVYTPKDLGYWRGPSVYSTLRPWEQIGQVHLVFEFIDLLKMNSQLYQLEDEYPSDKGSNYCENLL